MTHDEAMSGEGHPVSFEEAQAEMKRHGMETRDQPFAGCILARSSDLNDWEEVPLNSKDILEWLGY